MRIIYWLREKKADIVFGFQRMFRGYDDTAFWNLNEYIARIALPVLKDYRENKSGRPYNKDTGVWHTEEQWNARLDRMIKSFELILGDYDYPYTGGSSDLWNKMEETEKGLIEFGTYFQSLWD